VASFSPLLVIKTIVLENCERSYLPLAQRTKTATGPFGNRDGIRAGTIQSTTTSHVDEILTTSTHNEAIVASVPLKSRHNEPVQRETTQNAAMP
jgi:hypothetical protein